MEPRAVVSEITLEGMRSTEEPRGTVAMPIRDNMNTRTFRSYMMTDWPRPIDQIFASGNLLVMQRNTLLNRMRGEWILFIDDDMTWEPDAVKRLLSGRAELEAQGHEVDIIGGLCFRRSEPHHSTMYVKHDDGAYNYVEDWDTDVVEVDATGMAFCLISKRALERIAGTEMPPYEARINFHKSPDFFQWHGSLGEDLRFCNDVKQAGGRIFVDTRVKIGHMAEKEITYRDFLREVSERDPEFAAMRRRINKKMKLPTLDKREARKRYDALA